MTENNLNKNNMWEDMKINIGEDEQIARPSLTYWQDVWSRLRRNKLSIFGLIIVICLIASAIIVPMVSSYKYSDTRLDFTNIPVKLQIYKLDDNTFVYPQKEYKLYMVSEKGEVLSKITETENNMIERYKKFDINGTEVVLDYGLLFRAKQENPNVREKDVKPFELKIGDRVLEPYKNVYNKSNWFGTDTLGRDVFARVFYGARISLLVAFVATVVNFFIGVTYGCISGYYGGKIDNVMMRIVDIISTVPLILIVILLMVFLGEGLWTIILTFSLVYWVGMARLVRGQVLSLKEQEFILAAKTIGVSTWRIIYKHLLPNAMGTIIVSMTMMIPSAIFTESFLSFIGLGVSAPQASWGTLANEAIAGLRLFPYQLIAPSVAICITMLAFNFLGDGLRDALDPKLRK